MMTRLLEILISIAIVAVLFLVVGAILPSQRSITESVETNRRLPIVFDTLNSLRRFDDWNPLVLRDPKAQLKLVGPAEGVGARLEFVSANEAIGTGSWEIVESERNKRVAIDIEDASRGTGKRTEFKLKPTGQRGRNVAITQTYEIDYGWDIIGRYQGLYLNSNVGDDMKLGLQRLGNMLATIPNQDYSMLGQRPGTSAPRIDQRAAENLLVVGAAVDRAKVQDQIKGNMEWIRKVMAANGLSAAGPMRIVTNELGQEMYSFEVVQPVRRGGATTEASAAAAADAGGKLDIALQGPVEARFTEPARVVTASFRGHMNQLGSVRDTLRAWALTRGYETAERPYEAWKSGIDPSFTPEGEFDVYWVVR